MTFYLYRRLDEVPSRRVLIEHRTACFGDEDITILMLVHKNQYTGLFRAIVRAVLVDSFDGFAQNGLVQCLRVVFFHACGFPHAYIDDMTADPLNLVEERFVKCLNSGYFSTFLVV